MRFLKPLIPLRLKRSLFARKVAIKLFNVPIKTWYFREDSFMNFGDELAVDIIERLFKKKINLVTIEEAELFTVGSIIEVVDQPRYKKAYVWGSGLMAKGDVVTNTNLIFRAVRGRYTRDRLRSQYKKIPLGDPGLLCSLIYKSTTHRGDKIGIIPHYVDEKNILLDTYKNDDRFLVISVKASPSEVIENIMKCKVIFSSSLHGLIVSDSFGVPNIHLTLSDKLLGAGYKFKDYYSATNREYGSFKPADLRSEEKINGVIEDYKPIENLNSIQQALIQSFPFR